MFSFIFFYHFIFHFFINFLSFVYHFIFYFLIIFLIIFSSSGAKKNPKNGKLQFSPSFFHFFIIFASGGGIDEK